MSDRGRGTYQLVNLAGIKLEFIADEDEKELLIAITQFHGDTVYLVVSDPDELQNIELICQNLLNLKGVY